MSRPAKRQRVETHLPYTSSNQSTANVDNAHTGMSNHEHHDESVSIVPPYNSSILASLNRSISPPLRRSRPSHQDDTAPSSAYPPSESEQAPVSRLTANGDSADSSQPITATAPAKHEGEAIKSIKEVGPIPQIPSAGRLRSPIQLTHIRDIPDASGNNDDTVKLKDILGDPMIRECWQFNFLFDVDFLMSQFDEDVRRMVKVKVVHGSWKRDAPNRIRIDGACSRYPNVEPIVAYMSEPFGTHHSKMMILLRHDDLAQVIIHTANMIPQDWANMCQAVWRSPLLPLDKKLEHAKQRERDSTAAFGTGTRFKRDLLAYLDAYGTKKTGSLVKQLTNFDFSDVRAALIASVPSKQVVHTIDSSKETLWGWPALKDTLRQIPRASTSATPHFVIQVSSIASLGQTDKWLKDVFFDSLEAQPRNAPRTTGTSTRTSTRFSIIFPTPDEIRRSLNGYGSGGSIHMKIQSAAQQKQLRYMRPYMCHWAGDSRERKTTTPLSSEREIVPREAGRRRAAPHIKTYIRFSDARRLDSIDWAMVTSANLSTQAWGAAANANGEVRICSWEIGVVVWPDVFVHENGGRRRDETKAIMVPCFKRDLPEVSAAATSSGARPLVVGLRMPYDLPLTPYTESDAPWCATAVHAEPDWLGQTWEG